MKKNIFKAKPFYNKNNKQISFVIPKKQLTLKLKTQLKQKVPKLIKFKLEDIEW